LSSISAFPQNGRLSQTEFETLFREVSNWERWGADDSRGALNFITPEHVIRATRGVRTGRTVGLGLPLDTVSGPDNPSPAVHRMTALPNLKSTDEVQFACDFIGVDYHGDAHTHVDALCHVAFRGQLYNGVPADSVTSDGARRLGVECLGPALVSRGVLLDIPRSRAIKWLEPGDFVTTRDLEQAETAARVRVSDGDILLCRTGYHRRRAELGPWNAATAKVGFHPGAMAWVHSRCVAAVGSDGDSDTVPSLVEGIEYPIHVLAMSAMGVVLMDCLGLEALSHACEEEGRWDFLFVTAPLMLIHGTGSPVNPIAVF
jgi:kynurenine formamidase